MHLLKKNNATIAIYKILLFIFAITACVGTISAQNQDKVEKRSQRMQKFTEGRNAYIAEQAKLTPAERIFVEQELQKYDIKKQKQWMEMNKLIRRIAKEDVIISEAEYGEALDKTVENMKIQAEITLELVTSLRSKLSNTKAFQIIHAENVYTRRYFAKKSKGEEHPVN
ncbi:MAG: hypothetical protein Q3998_05795 [Porphyromonas sp.]|nr:hypothetical protein [Porphyromonas sp.]